MKQTYRAARFIMILAVMAGLALSAGCGVTTVIKDTASYVGEYFQSSDGLRKRVVIIPFGSGIPGLKARAAALGLSLEKGLAASGNFTVEEMKALAEEVAKVPADIRNPPQRLLIAGRQLGLNTVISGQITDLSVAYDMTGIYGFRENTPYLQLEANLRLVDVSTGTVVLEQAVNEKLELEYMEAQNIRMGQPPNPKQVDELQVNLIKSCLEVMLEAMEEQRWAGYVLSVDGDEALTTVGRDTGLSTGSTLAVYGLGEVITTGSGLPINLPGPQVGTITITKFNPRTAIGKYTAIIPEVEEVEEDEAEAEEYKEAPGPGQESPEQAEEEAEKEEPEPKPAPAPAPIQPGMILRTY